MKKIGIITSAAFLMFTAALNAQTDTVPKPPVEPVPAQTTDPVPAQPVATEKPVSTDKYNNWSTDTYKMQPMPEALSNEKIFPVLGKYQLTDKEGTASAVSVTLDPSNKGIVWIEGLPQGKIKATLRKSPATYKIPVQKLGEEAVAAEVEVKDEKNAKTAKNVKVAKQLPEGVLIYDKDANLLNVCIGCIYNSEDPATVFMSAEPVAIDETDKKVTKAKSAKKSTAKIVRAKPIHYSGTKIIETTAVVETNQ